MKKDDLISRAAAIAWFFRPYSNEESYSNLDVERALKAIPAVDAAPVVHGRWIHCDGKSHIWYCSNCGEKVNYNNAHKVYAKSTRPIEEVNHFCRNCGAKMDGERRDSE